MLSLSDESSGSDIVRKMCEDTDARAGREAAPRDHLSGPFHDLHFVHGRRSPQEQDPAFVL